MNIPTNSTKRRPRKSIKQPEIKQALSFIPAEDRDMWVRMASAIKSELGDDGYELWDDWSQSAYNYNERDARDVWQSINRDGGISIGSLIFEAKNHGWERTSTPVSLNIPKKHPPTPQPSTQAYAKSLWLASESKSVTDHPYAKAKGINCNGGVKRGIATGKIIGNEADCIIVPIREFATGKVMGVQCINSDGDKQTFGSLSGNGFFCGDTLDKSVRWFVVEGWADAVSMVYHHYDGNAVAFAALGKGNMARLAEEIVNVFAPETVVIVEDSE